MKPEQPNTPSVAQQLQIHETLGDSMTADEEDIFLTAAHREELDRRLDAYEKNPDAGRPMEIVMDEIRIKLNLQIDAKTIQDEMP